MGGRAYPKSKETMQSLSKAGRGRHALGKTNLSKANLGFIEGTKSKLSRAHRRKRKKKKKGNTEKELNESETLEGGDCVTGDQSVPSRLRLEKQRC